MQSQPRQISNTRRLPLIFRPKEVSLVRWEPVGRLGGAVRGLDQRRRWLKLLKLLRLRVIALALGLLWVGVGILFFGCDTPSPESPKALVKEAPKVNKGDLNTSDQPPIVELVESWPVGTTLNHPDIPDAPQVWMQMIEGATISLDFLEFYGFTQAGSEIEAILQKIEERATAGVKVRFVFDKKFEKFNAEVPARLKAHPNIEVRIIDLSEGMGGVLHIKTFIVDGREAYVGSQNFDWRSLEQIQELGLRLRDPSLIVGLKDLFAMDWAIAGGEDDVVAGLLGSKNYGASKVSLPEGEVRIRFAASPKEWLPDPGSWDLPMLLEMIGSAKTRVRFQVMSYSTHNYDGTEFTELEDALKAAAARGVAIEVMVADWSKKEKSLGPIQALQSVEGVTVKFVTIPQWSGGFVPFARVIHCKYMTVDGAHAWIGTSNWSGDYFYKSRNAGFVFDGEGFTARLDGFFEDLWGSDYAEVVDPEKAYEPPRVKE